MPIFGLPTLHFSTIFANNNNFSQFRPLPVCNCSQTPGKNKGLPRQHMENRLCLMTFSPTAYLEAPSTSGKWSEKLLFLFFFVFFLLILTGFMQTNKVNLHLKAKHYSPSEATGVVSHSSRWMKWTEPISWGELCLLSVCSEFKAAWSENKGAALLIQASGGSKQKKQKKKPVYCLQMLMCAVVGLCFLKWARKSSATLPNHNEHTRNTKLEEHFSAVVIFWAVSAKTKFRKELQKWFLL